MESDIGLTRVIDKLDNFMFFLLFLCNYKARICNDLRDNVLPAATPELQKGATAAKP